MKYRHEMNLIWSTYALSFFFQAFRTALHFMGETDIDTDEVHCIISNLIYEGHIKGYISLQHQKLIISKQNPFPNFKKWKPPISPDEFNVEDSSTLVQQLH